MARSSQVIAPVVCILAGGQSSRMNGMDKARLEIAGHRLIDRVIAAVRPQAGLVLVSGNDDRGTGLVCVSDDPEGPDGPAAGLWSVARWLRCQVSEMDVFFTVPVDAPFISEDIIARLSNEGACAVATDETGLLHPTFACWHIETLLQELAADMSGRAVGLGAIAKRCHARRVHFDRSVLININTPEDAAHAEEMI